MDDQIGHCFAIIATNAFSRTHPDVVSRMQALTHLKWVALPDEHAGVLDNYGAPLILVRPDRYVHAVIAGVSELLTVIDDLPLRLY